MIPDFPKVKTELKEFWVRYLENKQKELLGFWSSLPSRIHHEGSAWVMKRVDGSIDHHDYTPIESIFTVDFNEAPHLTPERLREKLNKVAEDMARQLAQGFIGTLNETLEKTGQTKDAKGRPFSKELLLEMLEMVELDFDERGEPILPALVMAPQLYEKIKSDVPTWDQDPVFNAAHEAIIERKRTNWRDRESHRKLVD